VLDSMPISDNEVKEIISFQFWVFMGFHRFLWDFSKKGFNSQILSLLRWVEIRLRIDNVWGFAKNRIIIWLFRHG
jgi:hypothetical protein